MRVRDWKPEDMPLLAEFHHQMRVGYPLPEHFGPLFPIRKVVVDEQDRPIAFSTVKIVSEAFFWYNPESSKIKKTRALTILSGECRQAAIKLGLEETSCWIPQRIAETFSKILSKLGWRKSPWPSFSTLLK